MQTKFLCKNKRTCSPFPMRAQFSYTPSFHSKTNRIASKWTDGAMFMEIRVKTNPKPLLYSIAWHGMVEALVWQKRVSIYLLRHLCACNIVNGKELWKWVSLVCTPRARIACMISIGRRTNTCNYFSRLYIQLCVFYPIFLSIYCVSCL